MTDPTPGDLLVWYVPMPPRRSHTQPVRHLGEALAVLDFVKTVQADVPTQMGVVRWEPDGDGDWDWFAVENQELAEVAALLATNP